MVFIQDYFYGLGNYLKLYLRKNSTTYKVFYKVRNTKKRTLCKKGQFILNLLNTENYEIFYHAYDNLRKNYYKHLFCPTYRAEGYFLTK